MCVKAICASDSCKCMPFQTHLFFMVILMAALKEDTNLSLPFHFFHPLSFSLSLYRHIHTSKCFLLQYHVIIMGQRGMTFYLPLYDSTLSTFLVLSLYLSSFSVLWQNKMAPKKFLIQPSYFFSFLFVYTNSQKNVLLRSNK